MTLLSSGIFSHYIKATNATLHLVHNIKQWNPILIPLSLQFTVVSYMCSINVRVCLHIREVMITSAIIVEVINTYSELWLWRASFPAGGIKSHWEGKWNYIALSHLFTVCSKWHYNIIAFLFLWLYSTLWCILSFLIWDKHIIKKYFQARFVIGLSNPKLQGVKIVQV